MPGQRVVAGQGLHIVIEVDQQPLAEARLDETVGVAVVGRIGCPAHPGTAGSSARSSRRRSGRPSRSWTWAVTRRHPITKTFECVMRQEAVLVHGDVVQFVAHARPGQQLVTLVQRHRHQQVILELRLVVVDELLRILIDVLHQELRHHLDALPLQDVAQILGGDGLGEGARQRSGVDELHPVPDALLVEEPVGQHDELERATGHLMGFSTTFSTSRPPCHVGAAWPAPGPLRWL